MKVKLLRRFREDNKVIDIRQELLEHCINRRDGKQVCVDASDYRRWAGWLEKQGETSPILSNSLNIGKNEQKPTWSEKDELNLKQAIYVCHQNGYTAVENWLKSLRPHNKWKPTEEQMSCFKQAIDLFKMKVNDDLVLWNLNSLQ